MKMLLSLLLAISAGLNLVVPTSRSAFFIPIPSAFAPVTEFSCPDAGTVFTYDIRLANTNRPNRMTAIERDQLNCRIRSDAQGVYDWFGGLGPHLEEADVAEKQVIAELWPLRAGTTSLCYTTTLWWSPSLKWVILQWPNHPSGYKWGLLSVSSPSDR
jgi:hypothetical protein